jgi:hypothetical protein
MREFYTNICSYSERFLAGEGRNGAAFHGHNARLDEDDAKGRMDARFEEVSKGARTLAPRLIGLEESDAKAATEAEGHGFRVRRRDGVLLALRLDRRPDRITVAIENGKVTAADVC